ncbi:MAG: diguanylate cyclase (GGDEF)-like protein [Acidimicrobiales bacterium]
MLPGASDAEAAVVAERARAAVEAAPIPGGDKQPSGRVTISVGVAVAGLQSHSDLVERADSALYEAKEQGRNQVRVAS